MTPEGWRRAHVGDAVEAISRTEPVAPEQVYDLLGVRWYGKGCHLHSTTPGSSLKTPVLSRVAAGDVTYNKMWVTKGAFAVVDTDCDGLAATTEYPLFVVRPDAASPEYIRWLMITNDFVTAATDVARGTTSRKRLNPGDFLKLAVLLPPLPEQRKIAAILSSVDDAIEKTQIVIDQLGVVKKAMMQELLTRGLPGRHTRFKMTEIGEVPEEWEVVPAATVCTLITKGTTPKASLMSPDRGDVPYLKVYNISPSSGCVDFTYRPTFVCSQAHHEDLKRSRVYPRDVLMNIVGPPLGKVAIVPDDYPEWNINQAISVFRTTVRCLPEFLFYCLSSEHLFSWAMVRAKRTSTQLNLTLEICRSFPMPLPSVSEQERIVESVEAVDRVLAIRLALLQQTSRVKSALMSVLLTGEVRVKVEEEAPTTEAT